MQYWMFWVSRAHCLFSCHDLNVIKTSISFHILICVHFHDLKARARKIHKYHHPELMGFGFTFHISFKCNCFIYSRFSFPPAFQIKFCSFIYEICFEFRICPVFIIKLICVNSVSNIIAERRHVVSRVLFRWRGHPGITVSGESEIFRPRRRIRGFLLACWGTTKMKRRSPSPKMLRKIGGMLLLRRKCRPHRRRLMKRRQSKSFEIVILCQLSPLTSRSCSSFNNFNWNTLENVFSFLDLFRNIISRQQFNPAHVRSIDNQYITESCILSNIY